MIALKFLLCLLLTPFSIVAGFFLVCLAPIWIPACWIYECLFIQPKEPSVMERIPDALHR